MNYSDIHEILYKIEELEAKIKSGSEAWNSSEPDEYEMANCDPSDQYLLSQEKEQLILELKRLIIII